MGRVKEYRNLLERLKGQRNQIQTALNDFEIELQSNIKLIHHHEKALEIIKEVGLKTQQQLQFHISDMVTMALESVLNEPYQFSVEFIERKNRTECELQFIRDGNKVDPIDSSGVGAVDIASFALRIASYSMQNPKTRNVIILDEPFRYLSENYHERASQMVKDISTKLGIQFIIVTHSQTLASFADRSFHIEYKNKKSVLTQN